MKRIVIHQHPSNCHDFKRRYKNYNKKCGNGDWGAGPYRRWHGSGPKLRQPLAIAITGVLVVSRMVTLFTSAIIYLRLTGGRLSNPLGPSTSLAPGAPAE
jgi:hypothetical protein